jgi:hypothetical protein
MSQPENDEDIKDVMRVRTSRDEVRRRNREIMERANAELREGRAPTATVPKPASGKKEFSRLGLLKKAREEADTFWSDYRFFNYVPDLHIGAIHQDLQIDGTKFSEFDKSSFGQLFVECLKSTCLIDESSVAYLDLVNPDESYIRTTDHVIDAADEALLTNELVSAQGEKNSSDVVYTGHFLRKPQLMSNDLYTEGMQITGRNSYNKPSAASQPSTEEQDDFELVQAFDKAVDNNTPIFNPITKSEMRPKRVIPIIPDTDLERSNYVQVKFDEKVNTTEVLRKFLLDSQLTLLESSEDPSVYVKKRKFVQTNKSMAGKETSENCYMLRIENGVGKVRPVGNKILLKKQMNGATDDVEVHLV